MDSPRTSRAGSRSRRKIFSCSVCDEVFIDEESLRRHELTHQSNEANNNAGEAAPAGEAQVTGGAAPEPVADDSPSAVQEAPGAAAPRARPLSSVRRQAAQAAATQENPAQVAPEANFLPQGSELAEMPGDLDVTQPLQTPLLSPMAWEKEAKEPRFNLGGLWKFVEDFSEWFVRGSTQTASSVGSSVISGVGLALRALVILAMAGACLYAGTWVGRIYGHRVEDPLPAPPARWLDNKPAETAPQIVSNLVMGFYAAINARDYPQAYAALSPEWQKEITAEQFSNGYAQTKDASCRVQSVKLVKEGRYEIEIDLEVVEKEQKHFYQGTYIAVLTTNGWKLDRGNIR